MTTLTIGQLAKRVGVRTSTLRYYEDEGLLAPVRRSEAGYRLYDEQAEPCTLSSAPNGWASRWTISAACCMAGKPAI